MFDEIAESGVFCKIGEYAVPLARSVPINSLNLDAILVPQGAEYQAVCRSLPQQAVNSLSILPIPMGVKESSRYVREQIAPRTKAKRVVLMGLCGSLQPQYTVGDVVLCDRCLDATGSVQRSDSTLSAQIERQLRSRSILRGTALTSDRLIHLAAEKQALGQRYPADIVEMEGFGVLESLSGFGIAAALLRVISDDSHGDIPDLSSALNAQGKLQPLPTALSFLQNPLAAARLIRGSLRGLKVLQEVARSLAAGESPIRPSANAYESQ